MGLAPADQQPRQETKHLGTYDVPIWALAALENGTDAYNGLQEDEIAEIRWVDIIRATHMLTYENDKIIAHNARAFIALMK